MRNQTLEFSNNPQPARMIRVFVSSTFRDMQAERDELVKRVFPQLRKLCEQRGVTWGEVDLRWGITDEQKAEGKVLPICLEEIRRCRPYFIGLLGERYGWIPDEIPQELIEREPWLAEHHGHSVTELEILHGVLNNPQMAEHAYFYFRDPAYVNTLSDEEGGDYREAPAREEIKTPGTEEARRRPESRRQKLAALKERIRASGLPVHEGYANPQVFGEMVLHDLTAVIDRLFPAGEQPDPLDREAADHEAYARSRTGVYIGRQEYFNHLDAHAQSDSQPLVVLGESGLGKSALLANWALGYRQRHPDELLLMHFIGATPSSADWMAMLRRIMSEFKRRFDIREEIPDKPDELRAAFANWLHMSAARGRFVLILDALSQLEDRDGAPDLLWLPPVIPANVRMFLSTLPGRPLEELQKRNWPVLQVEALGVDERKRLVETYLAQYTKALSAKHLERIAKASQAANPLYLRVLLDELRMFGVQERLDERISYYLDAITPDDLYRKVLTRCEQDYERERPGLVGQALSLIWAARRGLSEAELLELLGEKDKPLPGAHWSPLHLALEQSLISRAGLIDFAHSYLRQAVRDKYLGSEVSQRAAHLCLAGYFEGHEVDQRQLDELPWQLAQAGSWQKLYELLADLNFFEAAWKRDEFDVRSYWVQVETNSEFSLVNAYHRILLTPEHHTAYVDDIALLLQGTGHPREALSLREYQVNYFRQTGDRVNLAASLGSLGLIFQGQGDLEAAMTLYKEQERISSKLERKDILSASLNNQANIHYAHGDLGKAMALHKKGERLCRESGDRAGLSRSLANQALIFRDRGDLDKAMTLHKEQERLSQELGDRHGLRLSLGNQAAILRARGDLDGAMALFREHERLSRELGEKAELKSALGNQAAILMDRGDLDKAMTLHKEQERLSQELGDRHGLRLSLGNQAINLLARGDLDGAIALHREEERLCRELGDKQGLATSLDGQAIIHYYLGELDRAMTLYKEEERLCRKLGNKDGLQRTSGNQALVLMARGDVDGAIVLLRQQEQICRELGNKDGLQNSLGNQAVILKNRGKLDEAMVLHKEEERLCRELGNKVGLAGSLINQALLLARKQSQLKKATHLADEAHRLAAECGHASLKKQIENARAQIRKQLREKFR